MNREQAIEAIQLATDIFVQVITSKSHAGKDGHTGTFRITRQDALAAMQEIGDADWVANVHVSEAGRKIVIGTAGGEAMLADLTRASEFSHNDNNNGNF